MISNPLGGVKEAGAKRLWSPEAVGWRAYILIYTPAKPKPIQEVEQLEEGKQVEGLKKQVGGFKEEVEGLKEEVEVMELGKGQANILSPSKP